MSEFAGDQGISIPYPAAEPDRYLGVAAGLESGMETIASGSSLLLCSDGLIEPAGPEYKITPTELHSVLVSHDTPEVQVRTLMSRTLERGGGDNISCILTQFL
jgi:serine/threonine protein phosphatase PrpC